MAKEKRKAEIKQEAERKNIDLNELLDKKTKLHRLSGKLIELQKGVNRVTENIQKMQENCAHEIGIRFPDDEDHEYAACMECGKQFQLYKDPRYPFHIEGHFKHVIHAENVQDASLNHEALIEQAYIAYLVTRNATPTLSDEEIVEKINASMNKEESLIR